MARPDSTKVKAAMIVATPVVKKLATDQDFRNSVIAAATTAKGIYDQVGGEKKVRALAGTLAMDADVQKELAKQLKDVQKATKKATKKSHKKRNALIVAGITIGLLYNPATGPDTRRWIREKISGPDESFDYDFDGGNGTAVSPQPPVTPAEEPPASQP